jgi:hypothetical protein
MYTLDYIQNQRIDFNPCICIYWTIFKIKESISTLSMRERERERGSRKYPQLGVLLILKTTIKE